MAHSWSGNTCRVCGIIRNNPNTRAAADHYFICDNGTITLEDKLHWAHQLYDGEILLKYEDGLIWIPSELAYIPKPLTAVADIILMGRIGQVRWKDIAMNGI